MIAFSQANYAEPYRQHVNNDLIERVKAIPQFELQIADGAGNDNTQTSQVDNFVTQGVDRPSSGAARHLLPPRPEKEDARAIGASQAAMVCAGAA